MLDLGEVPDNIESAALLRKAAGGEAMGSDNLDDAGGQAGKAKCTVWQGTCLIIAAVVRVALLHLPPHHFGRLPFAKSALFPASCELPPANYQRDATRS